MCNVISDEMTNSNVIFKPETGHLKPENENDQ